VTVPNQSPTVRFTLLIDVEPDGRFVDPTVPVPWHGFEATIAALPQLRDRIARATGRPVHFSWFVRADPQVEVIHGDFGWAFERYAGDFARFLHEGDEVGLHVHPYRWLPEQSDWMTDFGDPAWIEHNLRLAFASYERALGRSCRTFRFGDGWMDRATFALLAELGAAYDATIEPGRPGRATFHPAHPHSGAIPHYARAPRDPYRPSALDLLVPQVGGASPGPWEVPVSTAPAPTRKVPARRRWPFARSGPPARPGHITPFLGGRPKAFTSALRWLVSERPRPYLRIPVRTSSFIAERRPNTDANLDWLFEQPWLANTAFVTLAEGVDEHSPAPLAAAAQT